MAANTALTTTSLTSYADVAASRAATLPLFSAERAALDAAAQRAQALAAALTRGVVLTPQDFAGAVAQIDQEMALAGAHQLPAVAAQWVELYYAA